ncbi:MAG: hypothetical protein KDC98_25085 [Planctomycetes bacterium]|nr:hypothetical protein [Planctomycetota bacterium]
MVKSDHGPTDTVLAHLFAMIASPDRMDRTAQVCKSALSKIKLSRHKKALADFRDDILDARDDKRALARLRGDIEKWMNKNGFRP